MIIPLTFEEAIFVRHPDTHTITRFDKPYSDFRPLHLLSIPASYWFRTRTLYVWSRIISSFGRSGRHVTCRVVNCRANPFLLSWLFPGGLPNRRIRWGAHQLEEYERIHLPPSLTTDSSSPLGKRSRSESEDTDLDSEWDPNYKGPFSYPSRVEPWVHKTSKKARARWEDDNLDDYVAEPVRSALAQPAAWVDVWNRHRNKRQRSDSGCQIVDASGSDED
ncbi:hypothetical protein BDZ89DRAFT_672121 [Hymenopellis radicata]|nr:hypothetical protein BDZ89DRAFT_672121 [Hymenopellis radicata]